MRSIFFKRSKKQKDFLHFFTKIQNLIWDHHPSPSESSSSGPSSSSSSKSKRWFRSASRRVSCKSVSTAFDFRRSLLLIPKDEKHFEVNTKGKKRGSNLFHFVNFCHFAQGECARSNLCEHFPEGCRSERKGRKTLFRV